MLTGWLPLTPIPEGLNVTPSTPKVTLLASAPASPRIAAVLKSDLTVSTKTSAGVLKKPVALVTTSGKRGLVVPIPMFPLLSTITESPIVEEPVNLGILLVVPLPVTVWAFAPRTAKPAMANRMQTRFIVSLPYYPN
jgi:hypothetical protein